MFFRILNPEETATAAVHMGLQLQYHGRISEIENQFGSPELHYFIGKHKDFCKFHSDEWGSFSSSMCNDAGK